MMNVNGPEGVSSVRIDGTYGPGPRRASDEQAPGSAGAGGAGAAGSIGPDAEVIASQQKLIDEAAAAPAVRTEVVEAARAMLEAGTLDTPEAAARAAEALLDRGI